ncbi:MAG: hypothetical protein MUC49_02815 [Raineya sp.]|jgi:hypothetical protein|nr:hypothetical protein [Raineya sp.]
MKNYKCYFSVFAFLTLLSVACSEKKNDCIKCAKTLDPLLQKDLTIAPDEIFYYEAEIHGSVGIGVEYEIGDTNVVAFDHDEIRYKNKGEIAPGGDKATKTFTFKAKKLGETTLTIKETFRGDVKKTYTNKIIVKH